MISVFDREITMEAYPFAIDWIATCSAISPFPNSLSIRFASPVDLLTEDKGHLCSHGDKLYGIRPPAFEASDLKRRVML